LAIGNGNMNVYIYNSDGSYKNVTDLISSMKYSCGIDKVSQQLNLKMAYGVYNTALPSFFFDTGQKIEVYINDSCYYRGKIETVEMSVDKETLTLDCYDYIRNLTKSKVCYNFTNISAYDAISTIFKDLNIPYSEGGIFGGKGANAIGSNLQINHLIRNKSAYDACMMIATEVHRNTGIFYYMFMDVGGNVNLMPCDTYWSRQTIKACSTPNLPNPDGIMINMNYKKDASDIITKVAVYDSKGNPVDIAVGASTSDSDEESGGDE
jgi:hypothetical protein